MNIKCAPKKTQFASFLTDEFIAVWKNLIKTKKIAGNFLETLFFKMVVMLNISRSTGLIALNFFWPSELKKKTEETNT
jgi:hypothetical protein